MTRIGIVGGGRAATLHAEAAKAVRHIELLGVGGRSSGSARLLAAAAEVPDLPLDQLVKRAHGLVIAVPPAAVAEVLAAIPAHLPVLVENPRGPRIDERTGMTAANLLHAPETARALAAIRDLGDVHHLALRTRTTTPDWGDHRTGRFGGGVMSYPGAGAMAVLLAATGAAVASVAASIDYDDQQRARAVNATLTLDDGRSIDVDLQWTTEPSTNDGEIEAAGSTGVVQLRLWPRPELELDGRPIAAADMPPLAALGFLGQMERFALGCTGDRPFWPPLSVGAGIETIIEAAHESARLGGTNVRCT